MNHPAGPLVAQFDQILNLSGIFAPLLPLDAALTFWAPLDYSLNDLRGAAPTFGRDTAAVWRRDDGQYFLLPSNQARFENGQLLMEPAITNKCENWNANPDEGLANISAGDATKTRISNPADIAAAGLSNICSDGNVIELENPNGAASFSTIQGVTGNTNDHTISLWANTFGQDARITIQGSPFTIINSTSLVRFAALKTPDLASRSFQIRLEPGNKIQFVLNQMEESPVVTSPIITQGAAGSRDADALSYTLLPGVFNQAGGLVVADFALRYTVADWQTPFTRGLVSVTNAPIGVLYLGVSQGNGQVKSFDSTNETIALIDGGGGPSIPNEAYRAVSNWNGSGPHKRVGIHNSAWVWSTLDPYDGTWNYSGLPDRIAIGLQSAAPISIGNVQIYNEYRDRTWIEENLTP